MNFNARYFLLDKFAVAVELGKVSQVVLEPLNGGWIVRADFGSADLRKTVYLAKQRGGAAPRVFKTADFALKVLYECGIGTVSVRLAAYEPPKNRTKVLLT